MTNTNTLSNSNNLKTSEILTLAYKHLWNGDILAEQYTHASNVCGAVARVLPELGIDNLVDENGRHPYIDSQDSFQDYMYLILAKTDTNYYCSHLAELGVPIDLMRDAEWMQLRRRELLCSIISHFESIND